MAAAKMTVVGDYKSGNIKQATKELTAIEKQAKGFSSSITKSFGGVGAALGGMFAAGAVVDFFKQSAQAAMEDEKSMVALATAMDNVGLSAKNAEAEGLIHSMSLQYGIADDQLRPAYQKLVTATKDVAEAQGLLKTAMDLSAAGYGDLEGASKALSAAANGNFTALTRLKVPIDQNIIKAKDFEGAMKALNNVVGGQAAAAAETYQGKMNRLTVAVGEAQEAIGYSLLNAIDKASQAIGGTGGMTSVITELGDEFATAIDDASNFIDMLVMTKKSVEGLIKPLEKATGIFPDWLNFFQDGIGVIPNWTRVLLNASIGGMKLGDAIEVILAVGRLWGAQTDITAAKQKDLTSATVSAAIAAGDARPLFLGMADAADEVSNAASSAAMSLYAMSIAREHGALKEKVTGKYSLELWKVLGSIRDTTDQVTRSTGGMGDAVETTTKELSAYQQGVKTAQEALAALATEMPNYVQDMSTPTFAMLNGQIDALKAKFIEAKQFVESTISSFVGQLDLGTALEQSKAAGSSLVEAFVSQGEKVVEFGKKVNALVQQGLEEPAWEAIMSLGYERGTEVADALASGNVAGNIANVNKVYESVKTMGDQVAEQAKVKFYDVGLQAMVSTLEAMIEQLMPNGKKRKQLLAMLDDLAGSMYRKTYIDVEVRGPYGAGGAPSFSGAEFGTAMAGYSGPTFEPGMPLDLSSFGGLNLGGMGFADGGIATSPTPGIFGEAGPEALIPLDRLGDFGGNSYSITVNAGVGDPRAIGKSVVEAITLFERSSGPVFARP